MSAPSAKARVASGRGVIVVAALLAATPTSAQQARSATRLSLAAADLRVEEGVEVAQPTLRLSVDIVDVSTGRVVDVVDVEGDRDRVHDLLLKLAASLTASDTAAATAASVEASALFALAQLFEERGYHDLAGDTYSTIRRHHPELAPAAQQWERLEGPWEITAYAGLLNDEPEYATDNDVDGFHRDLVFGLRGSYRFTRNVFVQGDVGNAAGRLISDGVTEDLVGFPIWLSLGYTHRLGADVHVYPTVGAGAIVWNPGGQSSGTDLGLSYGLGSRVFLSRRHAVRGDVRLHHVPNAFGPSWSQVNVSGARTLWALELTFGVSWFLGG